MPSIAAKADLSDNSDNIVEMYVKVNFGINFMYLILLLIYSIEKVGG